MASRTGQSIFVDTQHEMLSGATCDEPVMLKRPSLVEECLSHEALQKSPCRSNTTSSKGDVDSKVCDTLQAQVKSNLFPSTDTPHIPSQLLHSENPCQGVLASVIYNLRNGQVQREKDILQGNHVDSLEYHTENYSAVLDRSEKSDTSCRPKTDRACASPHRACASPPLERPIRLDYRDQAQVLSQEVTPCMASRLTNIFRGCSPRKLLQETPRRPFGPSHPPLNSCSTPIGYNSSFAAVVSPPLNHSTCTPYPSMSDPKSQSGPRWCDSNSEHSTPSVKIKLLQATTCLQNEYSTHTYGENNFCKVVVTNESSEVAHVSIANMSQKDSDLQYPITFRSYGYVNVTPNIKLNGSLDNCTREGRLPRRPSMGRIDAHNIELNRLKWPRSVESTTGYMSSATMLNGVTTHDSANGLAKQHEIETQKIKSARDVPSRMTEVVSVDVGICSQVGLL